MAKKFGWKQKKTIAMYINRRQWNEEFNPDISTAVEIKTEDGNYLVRESSIAGTPTYIITE
tara:strand:+ start:850 stop:1032 length:183 start_codon:yes stop_codon:yes gene_type:complete